MHRKSFLKNSALCAIAFSTSGFIRFNGIRYEGDCETTSDILGPFYRPNSPERSDLVVKNMPGQLVELSGIIRHDDCKTPYKKAKVELWHCSNDGVYDNSSDEFRYRGTVYCDENGKYSFKTILPPPYDAGGFMRPAHFHMMVTAAGYQSLVTQLYFSGDKHISKDTWASTAKAKKRILQVQSLHNGSKKVVFDVNMAAKLAVEPASIGKLTGVYTDEKNQDKKVEFFQKDSKLWIKNEVYGIDLEYMDTNKFKPRDMTESVIAYFFEILPSGNVKLTYSYRAAEKIEHAVAMKK
jgi:protocatechuate 3,4-dioxygenase beta subunit